MRIVPTKLPLNTDTSLLRTVPTVPATYIEMCTKLPLNLGHPSNEDSAYCPSYVHRDVYKTTSEFRTPL